MVLRRRHRPICSVDLDEIVSVLGIRTAKDKLQMFSIAFSIALCQHANGQLKDMEFGNARTCIAQGGRRGGVHRQCCDFRNGVPAGRADTYSGSKMSVCVWFRVVRVEGDILPDMPEYSQCVNAMTQYIVRTAIANRGGTVCVL